MATVPSDLSDVTGHNVFTNGQTLTHTLLNNAFGDLQTQGNDTIDVLIEMDKAKSRNKGLIDNFGFTVAIDSPATGDMLITFTQGDNSTTCSASAPARFNFWETKESLSLTGASTLKVDSTDDWGLDDRAANAEIYLNIYAIDRGGTLAFGVGPRPDFTRATGDFTATEGEAIDREHVFCTVAATANDPCYVVGYFKATYDSLTNNDWDSVTAESDVVGPPPGPHPKAVSKAQIKFDGTGTVAIEDSFNVISLTDTTTGDWTVTWDTDFSSEDYTGVGTNIDAGGNLSLTTYAAGSIQVLSTASAGAASDQDPITVLAFGDQ